MKKSKYTYLPKRKIKSVNTKNDSISGNEILDGVYVKGNKKFAKGGDVIGGLLKRSAKPPKTDKKIAKDLMAIEASVWDKLDIESGYQLGSDMELQKKYVAELEKSNVDKLVDSAKDREKIFDELEDYNYHTLNSYLTSRGHFGQEKKDRQKEFYATYKWGINPELVTEVMAHGGKTPMPMRMRTLEEKAEDIVGSSTWHDLDREEKSDLVSEMVGDGILKVSFEAGGYMDRGGVTWGIYEPSMKESDGKFVVYSRSHGIMSFSNKEDAEAYIAEIKKDLMDISMGIEDVTYAKGGVTEAKKFKVTYQLKGMDAKEKIFEDEDKAKTFLEMMSDDEDTVKIKMEEVVEKVKKTTPKTATAQAPPVSLFKDLAKQAAPKTASKKAGPEVQVPGLADDIKRYDELKAIIKNAEAEKEILHGTLRQVGIDKFMELYERRGSRPENFDLADRDQSILFIMNDKYEKVLPEKAAILDNYPGLLETEVKYSFDPATLDRVGEVVSRLIMESNLLSDEDKRNLIVVETKQYIKKGSIDRLLQYDNPRMIFDLIKPITGLK